MGNAVINSFDILTQPSKVRSSIGMVFQDPSSDAILTGYENLKLYALMYDVPMKVIDKKIDAVLKLVNLEKRKNDITKTYSGEMRRRMEIARGLLHEPEIKQTIVQLLKKIAPDTEPDKLQPNDNIREKLEIDSFDLLRFIVKLDEQLGVETPEQDYGKIATLKGLVNYIIDRKK